jgi:hypothetical protein
MENKMTDKEFDIAKNKFELALSELIEGCDDMEYNVDDVVSEILADYGIEF